MSPLKLVAAVSAAGALAAGSAVAVAAATGGSASPRTHHVNVSPMSSYAAAKGNTQNGNCPNMGSSSDSGSSSNPGSSSPAPSSNL
jgi:hypothetical protein